VSSLKSFFPILRSLAIFGLVWTALTGGAPSAWLIGAPCAAAAVWLSRFLQRTTTGLHDTGQPAGAGARIDPFSSLGFTVRFFWLSVRAGIDVAGRAFAPKVRLDPRLLVYPLRLPDGSARFFFMIVISLIPGTLTADVRGDNLLVHVLDQSLDNHGDLAALEERVGRLFSFPPEMFSTPKEAREYAS
jgi:multicomponent Na+:H+ antiporter subunit E